MNRPRLPFLLAALVVTAGIAAAPPLFDRLDSSLDPATHTEAERTEADLVATTGTDGELVALLEAPTTDLDTVAGQIDALDGATGAQLIHSPIDPDTVLVVTDVDAALDDDGREALLADFTTVVDATAETVTVGGSLALDEELGDTAESDLLLADAITIPLVLILFGLVLGGLRVALLPLTIVIVVLTGSLAVLLAISSLTTVSVFAVNVATLFGVGLAVDYGLLIVSRFREERATNPDLDTAIATTRRTAGRAVIYSGLTVATSLTALLVFAEPVLRSLAYGGIAATLLAVAAAHWLLPPLLHRYAHRIRPIDPPDPDHGRIASVARSIQRRPAPVAVATVAVLVALAAPLGSITFEGLDTRSLPRSSETRALADRLAFTHPDLPLAPIHVLVDAEPDDPATLDLVDDIHDLPEVRSTRTTPLGDHRTLVIVGVPGAATNTAALDLVDDIRSLDSTAAFGVTGEAAEEADLLDSIANRLPYAAALLATLTLTLLFAFTRAPLVALKAIAINIVSIAAAFGLLVWLFQHGALAGPLGFEATGALSAVILLVTFAFAFGLSMDYEVFLLARIREHHDLTGDNDLAVARGLQQSGRVVTQAAALIILVFIGFSLGELLLVKQLGIGLALAVAVDATLVRLTLLPALMTLLGERNWWNPMRPPTTPTPTEPERVNT